MDVVDRALQPGGPRGIVAWRLVGRLPRSSSDFSNGRFVLPIAGELAAPFGFHCHTELGWALEFELVVSSCRYFAGKLNSAPVV